MQHRDQNRRQFLTRTTALTALTVIGASTDRNAMGKTSQATGLVIDTHLHCFAGADDPRFPYHEQAPYRPEAAATPEHLLRCMDEAEVDHAIVVHPEPYQDDHRYLEHCLDVGQGRLKGTCLFFADRPASLKKMPEFVRRNEGRIVAARVHAYAPGRLPPLGTPEFRRLWKIASDFGLAMQLHFEPRYAPGLEPYIKEFSDTTVIIDHLGRPMQGTPDEHAVVVRWSELPNTIMKLSALPRQDSYPHRDVQPVIQQLTDAFGADRLIYGGGFNAEATGDSYRAYRERLLAYLSHLSETEQDKILGGTAARLFGFQPAEGR
ncbi:MAG: amidohydrolase family protein [Pirellulaceae bacterium]